MVIVILGWAWRREQCRAPTGKERKGKTKQNKAKKKKKFCSAVRWRDTVEVGSGHVTWCGLHVFHVFLLWGSASLDLDLASELDSLVVDLDVSGTAGNDQMVASVLATMSPLKSHITMELGLRITRWKKSNTGLWWKKAMVGDFLAV